MTASASVDCTSINLISDILNEVSITISPSFTVLLEVYLNGELLSEIDVDIVLMNGQSNLILTTDIVGVDSFAQGVYKFRLVKTLDDGSTFTEIACSFLGCGLECDVLNYISSNLTSNLYYLFQLLNYTETCDACQCEEALAIYNHLLETLEAFDGCKCA